MVNDDNTFVNARGKPVGHIVATYRAKQHTEFGARSAETYSEFLKIVGNDLIALDYRNMDPFYA